MSSYIVSARKYRPTTFDDVVGQKALTQTLCNAITSGKLAHAYLFCGPRGVGKTTCARIFAKTINCEHRLPSGEACNGCESCRSFDEGRSLNIHELDAASNNSVENIRDLIERVRIPPQTGKYKVFIIDEVHMLSSGAFNAFLKTLEEPPSYVIFILATTEKQKIIPTILSRCQIYDFKRIEIDDIVGLLKKIADNEGLKYEDEALRVIAEKADGGMRDALSTFDQEVIFTNGDVTYQQVIRNLNILDYDYFFALTDLFLKRDISKTLLTFDEIIGKGFDGGTFIGGLAKHMRNLLVCFDAATVSLLGVSKQVAERYREQALRCNIKFVYKALKLCNDCDLNYRMSRNKRLLVEITLIEIIQAVQEGGEASSDDPLPAVKQERTSKTLKSIFKETQKAAPQNAAQPVPLPAGENNAVAGVSMSSAGIPESVASTHGHLAEDVPSAPVPHYNPAQPRRPLQPVQTAKKPHVISVTSIRGLQMQSKGGDSPAGAPAQQVGNVSPVPDNSIGLDSYDESKFSVAWLQFAENLPVEESDVAGRMKGMKPELVADGGVIITVENPQVEKFMQPLLPRLEHFLQTRLNNRNVRVKIRISEATETSLTLNSTELFKKMIKENPCLSKINDAFQLEII